MSYWKAIVVIIIVAVLGYGLYDLVQDNKRLEAQLDELESQANELEEENRQLQSNIEYYGDPENLLKEVRENFNYTEEGEEMFIIVPSE